MPVWSDELDFRLIIALLEFLSNPLGGFIGRMWLMVLQGDVDEHKDPESLPLFLI
jgi:hypothetical protein